MSVLSFLVGLVLLALGGEVLVRGASGLAERLGIPPVVVGLTVVALGTSAPELAISVDAARSGQPQLAVGNVVGSTTANVLLVLGLTAATSVAGLVVADRLVRTDVPVMVGVAVGVVALSAGGGLEPWAGGVLLVTLSAYVAWTVHQARAESREPRSGQNPDLLPPRRPIPMLTGLVVLGIVMLTLGAELLVDGASRIAADLGVSELVIGLTIVAVGTSAPEMATSLVAARRGGADIAVGNVVGSNILNLLFVFGVTSLITPGGLPMEWGEVGPDLWVMVAAALACLPVFFRGRRITRVEGVILLVCYAAYLTFLVLDATDHSLRDPWAATLLFVVGPVIVVTLVVVTLGEVRSRRSGRSVHDHGKGDLM